jgi:hypothetical protein
MPMDTIECDAALSDLVLQAARQAIPADFHRLINLPSTSERNRPLLPLLCSLLDAVQTTAAAVADNAWDDGHPLDAPFVAELVDQVRRIGLDIESATQGPSH